MSDSLEDKIKTALQDSQYGSEMVDPIDDCVKRIKQAFTDEFYARYIQQLDLLELDDFVIKNSRDLWIAKEAAKRAANIQENK